MLEEYLEKRRQEVPRTAGSREKAFLANADLRISRTQRGARTFLHPHRRSSESSLGVRNPRHTDAGAGRALALCPPISSRAPDATARKDLGCFQANGSHVPCYLEVSLRGQAQHPHRRAIGYRFRPAQRGSGPQGGLSTSLPARPPGKRRRSHSGCAATGDARYRGRAWRAGSGRGSVRAPPPPPQFCGRTRSISPRHPAARCTRTPRSRVCGSPAKAGVAADCGAAGRPRSPPLCHLCLPTPGSWGTLRSPRKAAKWRAVSRVEGPGWVPAGWAAVQRPGPESPKAASHGPGLAVAAASSSRCPGGPAVSFSVPSPTKARG